MSVKNVGSKLARGVRQVKAQQNGTSSIAAADNAPVAAAVKAALPPATVKPVAAKLAPAKAGESGMQHPDRVWPD
ncbi:hypothetical protein CAP31_03160 [Sulfuriferula sp. AH1]|uniref:hypothetical protein n=1 Tax=Sulfuriferula sp. AH1 TaxID=1985873 RepID=UPI000B3B27E4|nr:hypothetical protein [Sulfuriferula sp. AH1]ARU30773.1 hypothetical protein CAP31_03160 [Sulfuriferula sp. AH1]